MLTHKPLTDPASRRELYSLIENKQTVEQFLAEELMLLFDGNAELEREMRAIVGRALDDLARLRLVQGGEKLINGAWDKDCANYKVLQKSFIEGAIGTGSRLPDGHLQYEPKAAQLGQKGFQPTSQNVTWKLTEVNHFAEFIRFYGEVVEAIHKSGAGGFEGVNKFFALKEGLKVEPGVSDGRGAEKKIWGEPAKGVPEGTRIREKRSVAPASYGNDEPFFWSDYLRKAGGGINVWALKDNSLFNKMDRVFGLAKGADVSGTTTDTMAFLQSFAGGALDPVFHLLPVAMIVSGGHHTMLEVAIPITLNGHIDYTIGLYKSLMPSGRSAFAEPRRLLANVLQNAEDSSMNRQFLVYYTGTDPAGCILFDETDMPVWRKLAKADRGLMQAFLRYENYPTYENVVDLITGRGGVIGAKAMFGLKEGASASAEWVYSDNAGHKYKQAGQHRLERDDHTFFEKIFAPTGGISIKSGKGEIVGRFQQVDR